MNYKAWVSESAKKPLVLETVDLGRLRAEDVEVAVEHCGLYHSDLSVLNNGWGISQYPAILGHGLECQGNHARTACRRRAGTDPGSGILAHPAAAKRLRFADWLAGGDRNDARLRVAPQRHAPN